MKIGFDDYLLTHSVEEFKKLPVIEVMTIHERIERLPKEPIVNEWDEKYDKLIEPILSEIAREESLISRGAYLQQISEKTGLKIKELQADMKARIERIEAQKRKEAKVLENNEDEKEKYKIGDDGTLYRLGYNKDGKMIHWKLANFSAEIVEEIVEDDGIETTHQYGISGKLQGRQLPVIDIPASNFTSLNWLHKWGTQAILEPGSNVKDYVRHATQVLSKNVQRKHVYTHTGWRKIEEDWCYFTGQGAIGRDNIEVKLSDSLSRYNLPSVTENETEAIRTSLSFLDIGKRQITLPIYSTVFLAPMTTIINPMPNFSIYAYGDTGVFKTTISQLGLCHFGDFSLVGNFSNFDDTANAIERKAFTLKDTLMLLDDYHPSARKQDAQNKEQTAQRIIRAYSNRTARDRLNSDSTEKGRYAPRGMLIITGEELVGLQSTLARILVIEFCEGGIALDKLTALQARTYMLPHAMTSYILWLKDNIANIQKSFPEAFRKYREKATQGDGHKKMAEQVAFLQFAMDTTLSWLCDKGVYTEVQAKELSQESWSVFIELSKRQQSRIHEEEPIKRFNAILDALISQGTVRIAHRENKLAFDIGGTNGNSELIGYYDELHWYLLPAPLWHNIQRYCITEGTHFPLSTNTFYRRLANQGIIQTDKGRHTVNVRIGGVQKRVLKFIGRGICENEVTEVTHEV